MQSKLAPGLLVASPGLSCPFFNHTLVLVVEHDQDGALGFVINRPTETPVGSLLCSLEIEELDQVSGQVWVGGPVAPETGWVLFDPTSGDSEGVEAVQLSERLSVSASRVFLERLAQGEGPSVYTILLGYAGWGPGQLDTEIREGSWIPLDLDPLLVFERDADERWAAAFGTLGIDPARFLGSGAADA